MEVVEIKRMPHAAGLTLPKYHSAWAAGLDLPAGWDRRIFGEGILIRPGCPQAISTGLAIIIPEGHVGLIRGRSGLAFKSNIVAFEGTLDADYRGELKVLLFNMGKIPHRVTWGDRIAQLVVSPVAVAMVKEVQDLAGTERGNAGFGSTG